MPGGRHGDGRTSAGGTAGRARPRPGASRGTTGSTRRGLNRVSPRTGRASCAGLAGTSRPKRRGSPSPIGAACLAPWPGSRLRSSGSTGGATPRRRSRRRWRPFASSSGVGSRAGPTGEWSESSPGARSGSVGGSRDGQRHRPKDQPAAGPCTVDAIRRDTAARVGTPARPRPSTLREAAAAASRRPPPSCSGPCIESSSRAAR